VRLVRYTEPTTVVMVGNDDAGDNCSGSSVRTGGEAVASEASVAGAVAPVVVREVAVVAVVAVRARAIRVATMTHQKRAQDEVGSLCARQG